MDLAETMKSVLAKSTGGAGSGGASAGSAPHAAEGYVTEKLYMLLQLYLQNKGWSPSIELLQCFSDLKDSSMLPSAAYLQMMASRVGLDTQGRLILRENGKIILPYEHFANAVMLKHMNGPHGLHLGLEATVRAVVESYTIGREQFGMEKEFIIEVVQNCPNPACRYYKNQLEMTQKSIQQHLSQQPTYIPESGAANLADSQAVERLLRGSALQDYQLPLAPHLAALTGLTSEKPDRRAQAQDKLSQHQQQLLLHQSRSLHQDKYSRQHSGPSTETKKHHYTDEHKLTDFLRANLESLESLSGGGGGARGARLRRAGAQPAAHAALRAPRHVQALRQAVRAAAKDPAGHDPAGAVAAQLPAAAAHSGHLVEERRQTTFEQHGGDRESQNSERQLAPVSLRLRSLTLVILPRLFKPALPPDSNCQKRKRTRRIYISLQVFETVWFYQNLLLLKNRQVFFLPQVTDRFGQPNPIGFGIF